MNGIPVAHERRAGVVTREELGAEDPQWKRVATVRVPNVIWADTDDQYQRMAAWTERKLKETPGPGVSDVETLTSHLIRGGVQLVIWPSLGRLIRILQETNLSLDGWGQRHIQVAFMAQDLRMHLLDDPLGELLVETIAAYAASPETPDDTEAEFKRRLHRWTRVHELAERGQSSEAIAIGLSMPLDEVQGILDGLISRPEAEQQTQPAPPKPKISPVEETREAAKARARALRADGNSYQRIAKLLGVTPPTVKRWCDQAEPRSQ